MNELQFELPNGSFIPAHFHITEVAKVSKSFVDCGGTFREEEKVGLQLWYSVDNDHRLSAQKLLSILNMAGDQLQLSDQEIEVEYQAESISKYRLGFVPTMGFVDDVHGARFKLIATLTACLAEDKCGIPQEKPKVALSQMEKAQNTCAPGSGCC